MGARAMKQSIRCKIPEVSRKQREGEETLFAEIEAEQLEEAKLQYEQNMEKKRFLLESMSSVKFWQEEHIGKKQVDFQTKLKERQKDEWSKKCVRAMRRFMAEQERREAE